MKRLEFSEEVKEIIQKSTFISQLHDIGHKDDIQIILGDLKKKHPKASHIVHAYKVDDTHFGFDDAGEPKGTAGQPVLDALTRHDASHVLCTVIRYFGGQLLGAQGLTKAYRDMAYESFNHATFKTYESYRVYTIKMSYPLYQTLKGVLLEYGIIESETFLEHIELTYATKLETNPLKSITYGVSSLMYIGTSWR